MSTKIYTGFRLPGFTLERAFHELQTFRNETLLPAAQLASHRLVVGEAVAKLDAYQFGLEVAPPGRAPLAVAWGSVLDRINEIGKTRRRDQAVDFDFEVTLFPTEDVILGISFTEQSAFHDLWLAQAGVEEYNYWNNTDKPDSVSEAEWDSRSAVWGEVLSSGPTPAQAGLSLTLCLATDLLIVPVETVEGLLPSFDSRVHAVTQEWLIRQWDASQTDEPDLNAMRAYRRFKAWLASPEGQGEKSVLEAAVADKLVKAITLDLLLSTAERPLA